MASRDSDSRVAEDKALQQEMQRKHYGSCCSSIPPLSIISDSGLCGSALATFPWSRSVSKGGIGRGAEEESCCGSSFSEDDRQCARNIESKTLCVTDTDAIRRPVFAKSRQSTLVKSREVVRTRNSPIQAPREAVALLSPIFTLASWLISWLPSKSNLKKSSCPPSSIPDNESLYSSRPSRRRYKSRRPRRPPCQLWRDGLSGAISGAFLSASLLFLVALLDDPHGGGHTGGGLSSGGFGSIIEGPATTLGRLASDLFPTCSLQHTAVQNAPVCSQLCRLIAPWFVPSDWSEIDSTLSSSLRRGQAVNKKPGAIPDSINRQRAMSDAEPPESGTYLVLAGQMVVEGGDCNIAQLDLDNNQWSLKQRIQLSLYNSFSGGEVYSLLGNRTTYSKSEAGITSPSASSPSTQHNGMSYGELIVVGAFDTTYRKSQVTYCSVGIWDGTELIKMGDGLCNSGLSKGMKITAAAFAGPHDVYVAGSFHTQVWNGERSSFVKIFNIAHFNSLEQVWLPLEVGQLTCSWCIVTVLALAWDSKRMQLHVAGKFNSIENKNVPAGLAVYNFNSGHLVAHPGGGLTLNNITEDGVGTALQLDEESAVLYVMGSFERLSQTKEKCLGLAAFEIEEERWTCLAEPKHTVEPTGGGNMLLTPYGLMVAGRVSGEDTTWPYPERPYTIALLKTSIKTVKTPTADKTTTKDAKISKKELSTDDQHDADSHTSATKGSSNTTTPPTDDGANLLFREFEWSWLPGFYGHDEPINCLSNGYNEYEGTVFIGGDNFVAKWSYEDRPSTTEDDDKVSDETTDDDLYYFHNEHTLNEITAANAASNHDQDRLLALPTLGAFTGGVSTTTAHDTTTPVTTHDTPKNKEPTKKGVTERLNEGIHGSIMAISQLVPPHPQPAPPDPPIYVPPTVIGYTILVYCIALGALFGMFLAIVCNQNLNSTVLGFIFNRDSSKIKGISLDTLTYSAVENTSVSEAYTRAMKTRFVNNPNLLTMINPAEIVVHRIIGEGTFGRVWSAKWRSSSVAVKEFVFAQAAIAGKSCMQGQIIEEIIGEAGMMAILRHPNVLQLFGCCLTSQAIWIVSELCSLGSLRQLLDDTDRELSLELKLQLALNVAEGMTYLHTQEPPIIHRDLKSHNIFVHETFSPSATEVNTQTHANGEKTKTKSKSNRKKNRSGSGGKHKRNKKEHRHKAAMNGNATGNKSFQRKGTYSSSVSTIIAKIGDWGSARAALAGSRTMTHGVGTACWLAPEVIKHARSSKSSDVFGFGIILWELATREEVYKGLETTQIIARVANDNLRPHVPEDCIWKDLMVHCWDENPQKRLCFENIVIELNRMLAITMTRSDSGWSSESFQESYQSSSR